MAQLKVGEHASKGNPPTKPARDRLDEVRRRVKAREATKADGSGGRTEPNAEQQQAHRDSLNHATKNEGSRERVHEQVETSRPNNAQSAIKVGGEAASTTRAELLRTLGASRARDRGPAIKRQKVAEHARPDADVSEEVPSGSTKRTKGAECEGEGSAHADPLTKRARCEATHEYRSRAMKRPHSEARAQAEDGETAEGCKQGRFRGGSQGKNGDFLDPPLSRSQLIECLRRSTIPSDRKGEG